MYVSKWSIKKIDMNITVKFHVNDVSSKLTSMWPFVLYIIHILFKLLLNPYKN